MCCSGETAAGSFPVQAVQVMNKICRESEASLDYYALFKVQNGPIWMTLHPLLHRAHDVLLQWPAARAHSLHPCCLRRS